MKPNIKNPTNGDPVIESFQQTMQMFLEVQRSTMLAYLSGRGAAAPAEPPNFNPDVKDRARNHQTERPPRTAIRAATDRRKRIADQRRKRSSRCVNTLRRHRRSEIAERAEWKTARARCACD